jgi:adenine-specific DNA glycosylase
MAGEDAGVGARAPECQFCPFCQALAALREARPEAVEHLVRAGTELVLAVRALLEAPPADRPAPRPAAGTRLRRIDVG